MAGGLSAIGALSLDIGGPALPKHLESVKVSHVRQGMSQEEMEGYIKEATNDPLKQLWLEQVRIFNQSISLHFQNSTKLQQFLHQTLGKCKQIQFSRQFGISYN